MNRELWKLTLVGMRGKRKSNLLIFLVVILSFTCGIISLSVASSLNRTNEEYRLDTYGGWQMAVEENDDEDRKFLENSPYIEEIGWTECYGEICTSGGSSFIGSIDENFVEIGRIHLQQGRLPKTEQEIAMEADLLSRLGYDYTLEQEINLEISWENENLLEEMESVTIEKTYILTGVIKEYTNIWTFSDEKTEIALSEAMITEEAGKILQEEAKAVSKEQKMTITTPRKTYFLTLEQKDMIGEGIENLDSSGRFQSVVKNTAAFGASQEADYQEIYSILIFGVTILAVFCIYLIYMQKEVRQVALFRSIGITKRQLLLKLFYETIMICIPAILFGGCIGYLGTKGLLISLMKSDSARIYVDIPVGRLISMIFLWLLGIVLARTVVYLIALKEPLTGRIHMANKKAKLLQRIRKGMVLTLSILFSIVAIFTTLESLYPIEQMKEWGNKAAYLIHSEDIVTSTLSGKNPKMLTREDLKEISNIPGIIQYSMYGVLGVEFCFDEMSEIPLVNEVLEKGEKAFREGLITTQLVAIPEECEEEFFLVEKEGIDLEKFRRGEEVIVTFPADLNGTIRYQQKRFHETGIRVGDMIQITINGSKIKENEWGETSLLANGHVVVGGVIMYEDGNDRRTDFFLDEPYTILCSETYLENLLESLPSDYLCGFYVTGEPFGFTDANIYADQNAGYLSTDYVLARKCTEKGFVLSNNREGYATVVQSQIQTLLLLWSSGGCIGIVLLLIIADVLSLESKDDRRKYGILQALGMSKMQMIRNVAKRAFGYGMMATVFGWIGYLLILFARTGSILEFQTQMYGVWLGGLNNSIISRLSLMSFSMISLLFFCMKRTLWREDLMKKLREER